MAVQAHRRGGDGNAGVPDDHHFPLPLLSLCPCSDILATGACIPDRPFGRHLVSVASSHFASEARPSRRGTFRQTHAPLEPNIRRLCRFLPKFSTWCCPGHTPEGHSAWCCWPLYSPEACRTHCTAATPNQASEHCCRDFHNTRPSAIKLVRSARGSFHPCGAVPGNTDSQNRNAELRGVEREEGIVDVRSVEESKESI